MPAPPPIELPLDWLERKLGRAIDTAEVRGILERLEFGVAEPKPGVFSVSVPSWRATKDVSIKDDLVEEVGRMVGYDSIPPRAPLVAAAVPPANPERKFQHEVRDMLVDQGFTEVYNYSFVSEEAVRAFGFDPAAHVRVTNPIASRPGAACASRCCRACGATCWKTASTASRSACSKSAWRSTQRPAGLPEEVPHLAAAQCTTRQGDGAAGLFEIKPRGRMPDAGSAGAAGRRASFEHPARAADVLWKGERVGRVFELHPSLVETGRAAVLDLDLDRVRALGRRRNEATRPSAAIPSALSIYR